MSEPLDADIMSFMNFVHAAVVQVVCTALAHGRAFSEVLSIVDGTPNLAEPAILGFWLPGPLEDSLHKSRTERFREACRALLDLERLDADHIHVLYYTADWWVTARLLVPTEALVTVKEGASA